MKRFFMLFLVIIMGFLSMSKVYAVTDTGGGNVSEIITDSSSVSAIEDVQTTDESTTEMTSSTTDMMTVEDVTGNYIPNVTPQGFFSKIYTKILEVDNFLQKSIAFLLIGFFVVALLSFVISLFTDKRKAVGSAVAILIIAIVFVCDIYAVQILSVFTQWLSN